MTLALIGAGFGRTGTSSLRDALTELGYPCYHMTDVVLNAERSEDAAFWLAAAEAPPPAAEWRRFFEGYRAVVDYPGCFFWRQLMEAFPEAPVVLTLHPKGPGAWYDSTLETIFVKAETAGASPRGKAVATMMERIVWGPEGAFGGRFPDREAAIARYEAHAEEVRAGVPAGRLLEFSPADGWAPICDALGEPVPQRPFPNRNNRAEMTRRVERLSRMKAFNLRGTGTGA
jgi:hypothetical protein